MFVTNRTKAIRNPQNQVGIKSFESSACSWNDSGNAAMPATMPTAMKASEMKDQITPQHCDEPPYL